MLAQTHFYRIVNLGSKYCLLAGQWGKDPGDRHVWHYPLSETRGQPENVAGFEWLLIPTDEPDHYFIINKVSGFALLAGQWGKDPGDRNVWHYPLSEIRGQPANIRGFYWRLQIRGMTGPMGILGLPEDQRKDGLHDNPASGVQWHYALFNAVSGFALLAGQWGKDPGDRNVWHYPITQTSGDPKDDWGFLWYLQPAGAISLPALLDSQKPHFIPTLDSLEPPEHFPEHLAKTSYLPCWMVNDAGKDFQWKLKHSPYYALERRERYYLLGYQRNGDPQHPITDLPLTTITVGFSKEHSTSFRVTTGISTTVEASAGVEGIASSKVSATISIELGFESTEAITSSREQSYTPKIPYIPPGGVAAVYGIQNTFTLRRASGELIKKWEVVEDKGFVNLVYP